MLCRYNRVWVLAAGAALWGTMTGLFAFTNTIWQVGEGLHLTAAAAGF